MSIIKKARREEQIQAAHEEAMFGASTLPPPVNSDSEPERENNEKEDNRKDLVTSLLSESVSDFYAVNDVVNQLSKLYDLINATLVSGSSQAKRVLA